MGGRGRRVVVGLSVLGASVAAVGGDAAARPVTALQWRGHAAAVTLTDCDPADAPGTECTAWDVFAFRQELRAHGERLAARVISVTVFDVTITGGPQPIIEYRSEGFVEDADVVIPPNLPWAHAEGALPLAVCAPPEEEGESPSCTPTGDTVTLEVDWTAAGGLEPYRDRFHDGERGTMFRASIWGRFRPATAVAEVDGEPVAIVMPPYADPPMMSADGSAELCLRCGFEPPL